jgi:hypothetical protein
MVSNTYYILQFLISHMFRGEVDAGSRAVIFDKVKGLQMKVVGEGTHFKIPYIQV